MSEQSGSVPMGRRGFVRTVGGLVIAAAGGSLVACREPLGPSARSIDGLLPSFALSAADDRLKGTARLIERPAGSGRWRLAKE